MCLKIEKGFPAIGRIARKDITVWKIFARCVIPKGTRYWMGEGGTICAERMTIGPLVCDTSSDDGAPDYAPQHLPCAFE